MKNVRTAIADAKREAGDVRDALFHRRRPPNQAERRALALKLSTACVDLGTAELGIEEEFRGTAYEVEIDSDEDGWHLIVRTDDDRFNFLLPHDVALELDKGLGRVREHEAEGRAAYAEYRAGARAPGDRLDQDDDPDHPDPEALRASGDLERKRRREEG